MGQIRHEVKQGECLSSIAARYGFDWQTLWGDSANADLKQKRKDPNVLYPGDVVVVPEPKPRQESCASGALHKFVCKSVAAPLRIKFLDELDAPLANLSYELVVDGRHIKGTTNGDGELNEKVRPGVKQAQVSLGDGDARREYTLMLGALNPLSEVSGQQARLANLGYDPGPLDDDGDGPQTDAALAQFQAESGLDPTGTPDDDTLAALQDRHGR